MDEFFQKTSTVSTTISVTYLKLNIKYKYQIMKYHHLQITLAYVLKILGVRLTSGTAQEKDQFLSPPFLGQLLWDLLLSQIGTSPTVTMWLLKSLDLTHYHLRLNPARKRVLCPLPPHTHFPARASWCLLGCGWVYAQMVRSLPKVPPQLPPPNLDWRWRSGGSPKGNLGIITRSGLKWIREYGEPKATNVTNCSHTCCDIWEGGLQGGPPAQNLAVDRQGQEGPIRECFLL